MPDHFRLVLDQRFANDGLQRLGQLVLIHFLLEREGHVVATQELMTDHVLAAREAVTHAHKDDQPTKR